MTIRYRWVPSWWRETTWPEFKLLVRLRNEDMQPDPDPDDPEALFGTGNGGGSPRHYAGQRPSKRDIDLLMQAHNGQLQPPTVPGV